jgi:hypothetical protein
MSFFQWVREGVRQAVVLGIADAVEDVGQRTKGEDFGPALARALRERLAAEPAAAEAIGEAEVVDAVAGVRGRRRLGRSLTRPADALPKAA